MRRPLRSPRHLVRASLYVHMYSYHTPQKRLHARTSFLRLLVYCGGRTAHHVEARFSALLPTSSLKKQNNTTCEKYWKRLEGQDDQKVWREYVTLTHPTREMQLKNRLNHLDYTQDCCRADHGNIRCGFLLRPKEGCGGRGSFAQCACRTNVPYGNTSFPNPFSLEHPK